MGCPGRCIHASAAVRTSYIKALAIDSVELLRNIPEGHTLAAEVRGSGVADIALRLAVLVGWIIVVPPHLVLMG